MSEFTIKGFYQLTDNVLDILISLEEKIFEKPLTREILINELNNKSSLVILIYFIEDLPCGYKIGFEQTHNTFFSWSGGIVKEFRKKGLAMSLLNEQHKIAKELGFSYIKTHTKNKYRNMLILNIKAGFDVTGIYKSLHEKHHGIILEKEL